MVYFSLSSARSKAGASAPVQRGLQARCPIRHVFARGLGGKGPRITGPRRGDYRFSLAAEGVTTFQDAR